MAPNIRFYDYRDPECPEGYDPEEEIDAYEAACEAAWERREDR